MLRGSSKRARSVTKNLCRILPTVLALICFASFLSNWAYDNTSRSKWIPRDSFYTKYHSVPVLQQRLREVVNTSKCPGATVEVVGTSHNGFPIDMVRLGKSSRDHPIRALITAGMHGRERSTSLVAYHAIERFCQELSEKTVPTSLSRVQLLVIPLINPDGQERSRLIREVARKNLRRSEKESCSNFGVDLNRNWPAYWNLGNGTSSDPCHDQYSGPTPLSEPESQAVWKALKENDGIMAHVDVHSFGQFIYRDWAYSHAELHGEDEKGTLRKQKLLARAMRMAIREEHGSDYIDVSAHIATLSLTARINGGTFMDSMMQLGIPSLTVELGPRANEHNLVTGYRTNETDLLWRCREMFRGFRAMIQAVDPKGRVRKYSDKEIGVVLA